MEGKLWWIRGNIQKFSYRHSRILVSPQCQRRVSSLVILLYLGGLGLLLMQVGNRLHMQQIVQTNQNHTSEYG